MPHAGPTKSPTKNYVLQDAVEDVSSGVTGLQKAMRFHCNISTLILLMSEDFKFKSQKSRNEFGGWLGDSTSGPVINYCWLKRIIPNSSGAGSWDKLRAQSDEEDTRRCQGSLGKWHAWSMRWWISPWIVYIPSSIGCIWHRKIW